MRTERESAVKRNYQKELEAILQTLPPESGRKLMLHSCCGPCSSYVLEYLTQYFDVTLLFYNPNIKPETEYERRLYWQKKLIREMTFPRSVEIVEYGWQGEEFDKVAAGMENEPEGGARCLRCFRLRLERTAALAAERGFDWFGTTLTVSPHKNAEVLNSIGEQLGEKYAVRWLLSDFKKRDGYRRSVQLSEKYGLYRQDYCGCTPREPVV